jgi:hypothetical protein
VIEHITEHHHAASHPLTRTAKIWMTELRHAAIAIKNGEHHVRHRIVAKAVPLGKVVHDLLALRRKLSHCLYPRC